MANIVYIAASMDGYITDRNNGLGWLEMIPNPEKKDLGFFNFMNRIDALVMGRNTFETVLGFGVDWPYAKPVFVCSNSLNKVPGELKDKVSLIKGTPGQIQEQLNLRGFKNLYIDGGRTIQNFLENDLIDEIIITRFPILLGGGTPLFTKLPGHLEFELLSTDILLDQLVSTRYRRKS